MPDDHKVPGEKPSLSKEFKEFSFDDAPKPAAPKAPPPQDSGPYKLTKEDMNFTPYRGMNAPPMGGMPGMGMDDMDDDDFGMGSEEDAMMQRDWEARQERTFDAAGSMFRHEHAITNALTLVSNLEIQSVVAAGILYEQYQGLPKQRRDDMVIAALVMDAENFDDIAGELSPETVGMVDEILRLEAEPDRKARMVQAESLEPDSKRIMMAMLIADMEMTMHEIHDMGEPGMPKAQQMQAAEFIQALAPGVDKSLRLRAVDTFNLVSVATDNGATLKEKPDGSLILNEMPDIHVEFEKSAAPPKRKPQTRSKQNRPRK
jgi:hypothetical protein